MTRRGLIVLGLLLMAAAGLRDGADRWIDQTDLPVLLAETSVEMRARDGRLLRAYMVEDGLWRLRPEPGGVDPRYLDMLIAYEDKRFYAHAGVDLRAMSRALGQAIWHRQIRSGGSTLTMQVARLLENSGTGTWRGKIRQLRVALALERRMDKDAILSLYLTHAPFGGNLEGVRAASLAWFGKEPTRLTPAQAALLVALPQAPEARRPDRFADAALVARDRVLRRMIRSGLVSAEAAAVAGRARLPDRMASFPRHAPHLADRLRRQAPTLSGQHLTLDADAQMQLEQLAARWVDQAGRRLSVAILVADHNSGDIVAAVGSAAYSSAEGRQGFVDMTRARRSPGSTLKPLVYGLAFDQGLAHPETLIHDGPVQFGTYAPQNFDGVFRGDVRVRQALQQSLNIPVVRLASALGPARIMAALKRAGAQPDLQGQIPGLAVALGGLGVSLWDMVQLYAALAGDGQGPVLRATRDSAQQDGHRILSPAAAWQVSNILAGLAPPTAGQPDGAVAYKTGTSYGHRDAWAIGYGGQHVIGVWMGRADGTPVPGIFGGDLAAPVLFEAFGRIKPALSPLPPPPPETLIVGSADLPPPLRVFRPRTALFGPAAGAPQLTFPPDGARLAADGAALTLKLRGGVAPFMVLANGAPVLTGQHRREMAVPLPGRGFATLVVVDAKGQSDQIDVHLK